MMNLHKSKQTFVHNMLGRVAIPEQRPQNHHGWHGDDLEKILEVCANIFMYRTYRYL